MRCFINQKTQKLLNSFIKAFFLFLSCIIAFSSSFLFVIQATAKTKPTSESSLQLEDYVWEISKSLSTGTAFAVGPNQFITNFHVIHPMLKDESASKQIFLSNHKGQRLQFAQLLNINRVYDLALLETTEEVTHYLNVTDVPVKANEELLVIGYPQRVLTKVKKTGKINYEDALSYMFPSNHSDCFGVSGGPVFNEKGQLVGIVHEFYSNLLKVIKVKHLEELMKKKGLGTLVCSDFSDIKTCFEREVENLKIQATQNEVFSQYHLAQMYSDGDEVEKNLTLALYWYEQSALQGYSSAQSNLAQMYLEGQGMERDVKLAVYWLEKSAEQGHASARNTLLRMYLEGELVEKDVMKSAVYWTKQSAEQGNALAQSNLGIMYYIGRVVEKDMKLALYWFIKASNNGFASAQYNLAEMYYRDESGVKTNKKLAVDWYYKSAKQGFPPARQMLKGIYSYGDEEIREYVKELFD